MERKRSAAAEARRAAKRAALAPAPPLQRILWAFRGPVRREHRPSELAPTCHAPVNRRWRPPSRLPLLNSHVSGAR